MFDECEQDQNQTILTALDVKQLESENMTFVFMYSFSSVFEC